VPKINFRHHNEPIMELPAYADIWDETIISLPTIGKTWR